LGSHEGKEAVEGIGVFDTLGFGNSTGAYAPCAFHRLWFEGEVDTVTLHFADRDIDHVLKGVAIKDLCDGIANIDHQHPESTVHLVGT
jgi:hypothetical protein